MYDYDNIVTMNNFNKKQIIRISERLPFYRLISIVNEAIMNQIPLIITKSSYNYSNQNKLFINFLIKHQIIPIIISDHSFRERNLKNLKEKAFLLNLMSYTQMEIAKKLKKHRKTINLMLKEIYSVVPSVYIVMLRYSLSSLQLPIEDIYFPISIKLNELNISTKSKVETINEVINLPYVELSLGEMGQRNLLTFYSPF